LGVPETRARSETSGEDWSAHLEREQRRYRDGEARLPEAGDPDARQKQLTRLGNAAGGAGLALLMQGRPDEAATWFHRAAERYRESFADAPPASWGRPIGAMKSLVLAGDWPGAGDAARWALAVGGAEAESPIGRYAAALACLVLGDDEQARLHADAIRLRDDFPRAVGGAQAESPIGRYAAALACLVLGDDEQARLHADAIRLRDDFPRAVGDALACLAAEDVLGYAEAVAAVLESFEVREEYLEDLPVADTVVVLQALARRRGIAADLASPLLPA
jgi:tetratricopeptide (TPR) repeat protein